MLISWCVEVVEVCARMVARCTARWFYRRRAHVEACSEKCYVHINIDIGLDEKDFPHARLGSVDMFDGYYVCKHAYVHK